MRRYGLYTSYNGWSLAYCELALDNTYKLLDIIQSEKVSNQEILKTLNSFNKGRIVTNSIDVATFLNKKNWKCHAINYDDNYIKNKTREIKSKLNDNELIISKEITKKVTEQINKFDIGDENFLINPILIVFDNFVKYEPPAFTFTGNLKQLQELTITYDYNTEEYVIKSKNYH